MAGVNRMHRTQTFLVAGAGFGLGAVVVAVILLIATPHIAAALTPSASATPTPTPTASPSAKASASPATKAIAQAVNQSLADSLGMTAKDLRKALHQGTTVQQLAAQKGTPQATLQATFNQNLKAQLDKDVSAGTITPAQEATVLKRYQSTIPHWSTAVKVSPSPSASPR